MKTKNSAKGDNQRQGTPQDENYSQEELLNMDELFDLQGGHRRQAAGKLRTGMLLRCYFQ